MFHRLVVVGYGDVVFLPERHQILVGLDGINLCSLLLSEVQIHEDVVKIRLSVKTRKTGYIGGEFMPQLGVHEIDRHHNDLQLKNSVFF